MSTGNIAIAGSDDGGMVVNTKKVRVGPLDPEDKSEADIAQLLVPLNYAGDLELRTNVDTRGDHWHGDISLFAARPSTVELAKVTVDKKGDIDTSGYANLLIKKLEAKNIDLNAAEGSILTIDSVKALEVNLKPSERAKIDIKSGTVGRLRKNGVTNNILLNKAFTLDANNAK